GSWNTEAIELTASWVWDTPLDGENFRDGFRLASAVAVPEPSTWVIGAAGLAYGGFSMFRRRRAR
ncbi:MAG: PEP-CTERM sorting domain-containing protein, partial [Planctomycetota bacterium]